MGSVTDAGALSVERADRKEWTWEEQVGKEAESLDDGEAIVFTLGENFEFSIHAVNGSFAMGLCLIDSGATIPVLQDAKHFLDHQEMKSCVIRGVSGKAYAKKGRLKTNGWGLEEAVLWPDCPYTGIVSTGVLRRSGWNVKLLEEKEGIMRGGMIRGGKSVKVCEFKHLGGLDWAEWEQTSCGSCSLFVNEPIFPHPSKNNLNNLHLEEDICFPVDQEEQEEFYVHVAAHGKRAGRTKMEEHLSSGHVLHPHLRNKCIQCSLVFGKKLTFSKFKPLDRHGATPHPFKHLSGDFYGPLRIRSFRKVRVYLIIVCEVTSFAICYPLVSKTGLGDVLQSMFTDLKRRFPTKTVTFPDGTTKEIPKLTWFMKMDQEPTNKKESVTSTIKKFEIEPVYSPAYEAALNGNIERYIQYFGTHLTLLLMNVDPRIACYAGEHVVRLGNNTPRALYPKLGGKTFAGKSPVEVLSEYFGPASVQLYRSDLHVCRRFGCLSFCRREPVSALAKGANKWQKCVYLGFGDGGKHRVGIMSKRKNGKQLIWSHKDRTNIKWCEAMPISNCDDLATDAGVRTVEKLEIEKMVTRGQETIDALGRAAAEPDAAPPKLIELLDEEIKISAVLIFGINCLLCPKRSKGRIKTTFESVHWRVVINR